MKSRESEDISKCLYIHVQLKNAIPHFLVFCMNSKSTLYISEDNLCIVEYNNQSCVAHCDRFSSSCVSASAVHNSRYTNEALRPPDISKHIQIFMFMVCNSAD